MAIAPRGSGKRIRQFANSDADVAPPVEAAIVDEDCAAWKLQIKLAERRSEKWENRCKRIIKRYREERPDEGDKAGTPMRMNVLWSNVQTLQPSIYGREPVPIAERRFLDRDVVGRVAAQILERAMRYELADSGFHDTMEQCVLDYLLVGRGVPWLRFKPVIGAASSLTDRGDDELQDRAGDPLDDQEFLSDPERQERDDSDAETFEPPAERLLSANVDVDYVHWQDFFTSKARFWKEVDWVARRVYSTRQDLIDDFGEEIGRAVPLEMTPETDELNKIGRNIEQMPDSMKKAIVYEIWDKPTRKVYTIAQGFDRFLEDPREDPLNLEGFWPCPKPLFATMTNDTIEPVPDYIEYQDQALEIDNLTNRISLLIKALKVAGVYDASQKQLARLLDEGHENKLIPVSSWAAFAEKGGLASAVSFLPIKEISEVLLGLTEAREQIKKDLYEITGLADIMRGQADPRETAEAVQTKGRWGSLRLQNRQQEVARLCRDTIRMMGEIMAEHFPAQTLIEISGAMFDEGIGGPAPIAPKPPQAPPQPIAPPSPPPMQQHGPMPMPGAPGGGIPGPAGLHPGMPVPPPAGGPPIGNAPGIPQPIDPQAQYAMQMAQYQADKQNLIMKAIELLKQDKMRGFRIDIETDSTINDDVNEDKAQRVEFLKAVSMFVEQSAQIGAQVPDAVPMLGKMLLFGVRGFRAGRDLESTIEEFVDKAEKDAAEKQNAPPQPNPEQQKAQADLQATQAKASAEIEKAKIDAQASAEDNARAMATNKLDAQIAQQKATMEMMQMQREAEFRASEHQARMAELAMKARIAEESHRRDIERGAMEHQHHIEALKVPKANGGAAR